jgi:glucose/arabinose dehydrogenase
MTSRALLVALSALTLPATAQAHEAHCHEPPTTVLQAGDLRLTELGTIGTITGILPAPGEPGRVYLAGQHGYIWVLENDAVRPQPFLDMSAEISPTVDISTNERGLQSIAFAPDYATSRKVYVFYSDGQGDSQVAEFRAGADGLTADPATKRTILTVPHSFAPRHYGGQLAFGPDGRLYIGLGDANRPKWAQTRRRYGSIVSLDPRRPRKSLELVAHGLRNPYRFTFDPLRGGLIVADVGESDQEEVDVLPRVNNRRVPNFGWPYREGRRRHRAQRIRNYVGPRLTYSHKLGTAIVGGPVVQDPRLPQYRGRYAFGDFCDGFVALGRVRRRVGDFAMTGLVTPAITSLGEDAAHRIYVATAYGQLYRLDPV